MPRKDKVRIRTALILAGLIIVYLSASYTNANYRILLSVLGIGLVLWGCYLWTSLKNRHWLFMLWGLLSPVGLLGIVLLKDKTASSTTEDDTSSTREVK